MSIPAWPATLPQNILAQGYKGGLPNNLLRQPTDIGPAKVRRRGTVAVEPVTGNILVTPTELAALITFYETTLLNGSLRFRWRDPLVEDITTTLIASLSGATMNLSLVDALAFISNPSTDLSGYEYTKIIVTDSAGKKAIGYIKAAGTGETLGDTLNVSNCENHPTSGFDTFDGVSATGFHAIQSTAGSKYAGTAAGGISFIAGQLFKTTFTLTGDNVSIVPRIAFASTMIGASMTATAGSVTHRSVITQTTTGIWSFYSSSNREFTVSNLAVKQVLTPSATGVTITSTPGGTTYNWASVEAGFNYNATSYSVDLYATEMRFTEPPTWSWVDGYFEVTLPLEILK